MCIMHMQSIAINYMTKYQQCKNPCYNKKPNATNHVAGKINHAALKIT